MKYTLLELTQLVSSSIDGDEINTINDTVMSRQIVAIIKTAYVNLLVRAGLPEMYAFCNLTASEDTSQPNVMTLPDGISKLLSLRYNTATTEDPDIQMRDVQYMILDDFLKMCYNLDDTQGNVGSYTYTTDTGSFPILYLTDKHPQWYTSFDDRTVIFDSYDSAIDSTLQSSKTQGYGIRVVEFDETDTFIPDLDEPQFALLINEAKALAWAELRQTTHAKAEQAARRGWTNLQKDKFAAMKPTYFDLLPNYGRK